MLKEYNASTPKRLREGEWHIPFGDAIDIDRLNAVKGAMPIELAKRKIAVARCARVSYLNFEGTDDYKKDFETCDKLFGQIPMHLSPTEHVAMALDIEYHCGNFRGFKQYRKFFADENLKDRRVFPKR
jgi:hypothetical protein